MYLHERNLPQINVVHRRVTCKVCTISPKYLAFTKKPLKPSVRRDVPTSATRVKGVEHRESSSSVRKLMYVYVYNVCILCTRYYGSMRKTISTICIVKSRRRFVQSVCILLRFVHRCTRVVCITPKGMCSRSLWVCFLKQQLKEATTWCAQQHSVLWTLFDVHLLTEAQFQATCWLID